MAVQPESYGYPHARINAKDLPTWQHPLARFTVAGQDDWKVTSLASIDRGIKIEKGTGSGDAVTDVFGEYETMSLPKPDIESRWYLAVRRRNWQGIGTTVSVAIPGTGAKELPTVGVGANQRRDKPGDESDQPVALVRVTQKDTTVQEIIDLRVWAHDGGVEAADKLALEFLKHPGAAVKIGRSMWRYELQANSVWDWQEYPMAQEDTGHFDIGTNGSAYGAGWEAFDGGGYARLAARQVGKEVQIFGSALARKGAGPASVVAVMPPGKRPWKKTPGIRCEMNPDGALRAEIAQPTNATPSFFVSYFVA